MNPWDRRRSGFGDRIRVRLLCFDKAAPPPDAERDRKGEGYENSRGSDGVYCRGAHHRVGSSSQQVKTVGVRPRKWWGGTLDDVSTLNISMRDLPRASRSRKIRMKNAILSPESSTDNWI